MWKDFFLKSFGGFESFVLFWFGLVMEWFFFFIFLKNALLVLNWEDHAPFPVFIFLFF